MNRRLLAAAAVLAAVVVAALLGSPSTTNLEPTTPPASSAPPTQRGVAVRERTRASQKADEPPEAAAQSMERSGGVRMVVKAAETDAPLAGAVVSIEHADGSKTDLTTGADGVAIVGPGLDEAVAVHVTAPGRDRRGYFRSTDGRRRPWWPEPIRLEAGVPLRGRVIDAADAEPIAGAVVVACREGFFQTGLDDRYESEDRTTSAADGTFAFAAVPATRHSPFASWSGVAVTARIAGYVDGSVTPAIVPSSPPTDVVVRLEREAAIRGRVVDFDGTPASAAEVILRSANRWGDWSDVGAGDNREVRPDALGEFAIDGVALGTRVAVRARGAKRAQSPVQAFVARADGPTDLVLRLAPLVSVIVRVVDEQGGEIAAGTVQLGAREDDSPDAKDGASPIRFDRVEPGRLLLCAKADGFAAAWRWIDVTDEPEQTVSTTLPRAGSLTGIVLDDAGDAVADAALEAGPADDGLWRSRVLRRTARTSADGTFRLDGLPTGESVLDVQSRGLRIVRTVRLSDSPLRIVVQRFGNAVVPLVVPEGGNPPPTCGVYLEGEDRPRAPLPPWEGGDGQIHIGGTFVGRELHVGGLPPGRVAVSIYWPDYLPARVVVDVEPGKTTKAQEVRLDAGLSIDGRVLDPSGAGVAGVRVYSGDSAVGDTDATGGFHMAPLVTGPHLLVVEAPGLGARVRVDVSKSTPPVTLVLVPTRKVLILVRDALGAPVVGHIVEVVDSERRATTDWGARWQTDARGVSIRTLLPGRYSVRVEDATGTLHDAAPLEVPPPPPGDDPGVSLDVVLR